jgi:hypothetical protein
MILVTGATQAAVMSAALQAPYCLKLGRERYLWRWSDQIYCTAAAYLSTSLIICRAVWCRMCPSVKALGTRGYCGAT